MFCGHCGKELPDGAKFCIYCGKAQVEAEETAVPEPAPEPIPEPASEPAPQPEPQPEPTPQPEPAPQPKVEPVTPPATEDPVITGKKRPKALIGIIAVVVVVVLAIAAFASGIVGGGPEAKIKSAIGKSVQAYSKAVDKLGLPSAETFTKAGAVSQELSVVLDRVPEMGSELSGVGVKLATAADMKNQKIRIDLGLLLDDDEPLASALLFVDGDIVAVGSPEIMDDTYLGVNTATLGEDLVEMLDYDEGFGEISFNLFELVEKTRKLTESVTYDKAAEKALTDAIEIESGDSREMRINGQSVKCTGYDVVIPADALIDYLLAQVEASRDATTVEDMLTILEDIGLPVDELDVDEDLMGDTADELEEGLEYLADELEDIELDVYLSGGYVMAVVGEVEIEKEALSFEFYFGGGKNYADDLSFEITGPDDEFVIRFESKGDHTGKDGAITDKSELIVESYGYTDMRLVSDLTFEPGKDGENFSWRLREREWDTFTVKAEGSLTGGKDSFKLDLEELGLTIDGETLSVELCYDLAVTKGVQIPEADVEMILTMDEDELYDLGEKIGESAAEFIEEIIYDYPLLEELLYEFY